jgi:Uma2 family endonuclease
MSTTVPTTKTLITAEEFMRMSFDRRVELVRGEIVEIGRGDETMPERKHGVICLRIGAALLWWATSSNSGEPASNDSFVKTGVDPDTLRGADVMYFSNDKVEQGALTPERVDIPPDLCVEVLSPSNTWGEVKEKIDEYLDCGVTEVWIAEPDLGSIEIRRADAPPRTVRRGERLTTDLLPGFEAEVTAFFGPN